MIGHIGGCVNWASSLVEGHELIHTKCAKNFLVQFCSEIEYDFVFWPVIGFGIVHINVSIFFHLQMKKLI